MLDIERVRRSAAAMKSIQTQIASYIDAYRVETQREEKEIRASQEDLGRKRATLSPDDFAEEKRRLEERLAAAQASVQKRRQSLERVSAEGMQQVQDQLGKIVAGIAAEKSLTLIVRKEDVVYLGSNIEITDQVLERLDQQLPTVRISDPSG